MFAGPNGSGKSTVKELIPDNLLGLYLNPDEIEKQLHNTRIFDFSPSGIGTTTKEVTEFFKEAGLIQKLGRQREMEQLSVSDGKLYFSTVTIDSYVSSVLTDFLRRKLLEVHQSFTFETVMSSPDKVRLLEKARNTYSYRAYLYYVATEDPAINIARVQNRVRMGGHDVPEDKIIGRYYRSLDMLLDAIRHTDRAYVFDNSGKSRIWVAEITNGIELEIKSDEIPVWFQKYVLDKLTV
jgi:predicted ABC-type ATPase